MFITVCILHTVNYTCLQYSSNPITATSFTTMEETVEIESNDATSNVGFNSGTTTVETFDLVNHSESEHGLIIGLAIMLTTIIVVTVLLILVVAFMFKKRYGKMVDSSTATHTRGIGLSVNYGN